MVGVWVREKDGHREWLRAGLGEPKVGQEGVKVMKGGNSVRGVDQRKRGDYKSEDEEEGVEGTTRYVT